jgi:hypothetical protein
VVAEARIPHIRTAAEAKGWRQNAFDALQSLRGCGGPQPEVSVRSTRRPTTLPEGTVIDLVADDEGDDLTHAERQALHRALAASAESAAAGRLRPVSSLIADLRRQ